MHLLTLLIMYLNLQININHFKYKSGVSFDYRKDFI